MLLEYILGGVVAAALLVYLTYALLRPKSSEQSSEILRGVP